MAADGLQPAGPSGRGLTPVRILRGRYRGRDGWITGTLADRAARGITRAIVRIAGEEPELLDTSSLEVVRQLALL